MSTTPFSGEPKASSEFPGFINVFENTGEADVIAPSPHRRQFLALSSAAIAAAGIAGCRRPDLEILPFARNPDNVVPGVPLYYATSMPRPGGAAPLLVECNDGRPTKIEGNPKHPTSRGGTDAFAQAAILDLYSPDRSRQVLKRKKDGGLEPRSWDDFDAFAAEHFAALKKSQGEGLRFLIDKSPFPALDLLRESLKAKFPKAVWHAYEPVDDANGVEGLRIAFGQPLRAIPDFSKALRIVSLDCDFLGVESTGTGHTKAFAELRREPGLRELFTGDRRTGKSGDIADEMNRLYVVESAYSVTGTLADHRLRLPSSHVGDYAIALAKQIAATKGVNVPAPIRKKLDAATAPAAEIPAAWLAAVADDLAAFNGRSLVIAGYRQPPLVHGLCAFINESLGNSGKTVHYRAAPAGENKTIAELANAIGEEKVKTVVVIGGNPAFNAPADLDFANALNKVPMVIRLGLFADDTSERSHWHLPQAHFLEAWGDTETADGTYSCTQPTIAPLHNGRSVLELLIQLSGHEKASTYQDAKSKVFSLLKGSFAKRTGNGEELAFKRFIQEGFIVGASEPPKLAMAEAAFAEAIDRSKPTASDGGYEVTFHPSSGVFDGRYAWNSWLLELPDPLTKLVWDNAAIVSPKTAEKLQVANGDLLEITVGSGSVKVPAYVMPGQADGSIALSLGYGKLRPNRVPDGGGFDVYPIRFSEEMHFATASVKKAGGTYDLVVAQEHSTIPPEKENDIIQEFSLEAYAHKQHKPSSEENEHAGHEVDDPRTRFQWGYEKSAYRDAGPEMKEIKRIALQTAEDISFPQRLDGSMQWGMVIDLNTCTGCSACVVACQAENNIPVVGKHEVKLNRDMHWISLHRYFMQNKGPVKGGLEQAPTDDPTVVTQPMMCQQCEAAPCESVCPVNASVHSPEGLNLQVYNRCIGTRYCSNNCPYKARRFNWFDFNKRRLDELRVPTPFSEAGVPETLKMQKNPEVTVRMRGVMEKCTYCIQRIEKAKIGAKVLAIKAGADKVDTAPTTDPKVEYRQGFAIREQDGRSQIIVPDGVVQTACAQACPTNSIVFGNVRDTKSRVYKIKNAQSVRDYLVIGELNTKPRTSYLPRLRNLNPKMAVNGGAH